MKSDKLLSRAIGLTYRIHPYTGNRLYWWRDARTGRTNRRLIDALVRPGCAAVDVGAHRGVISTRLHQLVGPAGHVYSLEPIPVHARNLTGLERRGHCTYLQVGASDHDGVITLHVPVVAGKPAFGLASVHPTATVAEERQFQVQLRTLDDVLAGETRPVSFVKVDVEGHEPEVLAGAEKTLAALPALLIEIEQRHHEEPLGAFLKSICDRGYHGWALFPDGLRPLADFDVDRDQVAHLTGGFQNRMPAGYINDFLFLRAGIAPPPGLLDA